MVTQFDLGTKVGADDTQSQNGELIIHTPEMLRVCQQMEDTRKLVRTELMSSKTQLASLKQRLALLISWPALNSRAQDAVRLSRLK